jgi:hypothetical protein
LKIVRFLGGLGNQMFQYAFYRALAQTFRDVKADVTGYKNYPLHNGLELENIFDISLNKAAPFYVKLYDTANRDWYLRKMRRMLGLKQAYKEEQKPFQFDAKIFSYAGPALYWGYWQNEDYFTSIEQQIRKAFRFKKPLDQRNTVLLTSIQKSSSVSIHIRRGDYLKDPILGGLCTIDYYQAAIALIGSKVNNPDFFIFSDDMDWCRTNITTTYPTTFISGNEGANSYIDMQLMSNCKHNIIANSSFSWWAAWLNNNPGKMVIGPKKWINSDEPNQLLPAAWIKI